MTAIQLPRTMDTHLAAAVLAHQGMHRTPPVNLKPAVLTAAAAATQTANTTKYSLGKGNGFPTQRRPTQRPLSLELMEIIEAWFQESGIRISSIADTPEKVIMSKQMLYT